MMNKKLIFLGLIIPVLMLTIPNVYAGDANPYCDLLSNEERMDVTCHDRKDYSDTTGLYHCNDGTTRTDWQDCPDVSGYDYSNSNNNNNSDEIASKCWKDGYDDGQDNPFDQDRYEECHFNAEGTDNPYYHAFIFGCKDAGNIEETCERFTDE